MCVMVSDEDRVSNDRFIASLDMGVGILDSKRDLEFKEPMHYCEVYLFKTRFQ